MRTVVKSIITAGLALVATASFAEARPRVGSSSVYVSGYYSCGTPIYTKRILTGYTRHGRAIYRHSRLPRQNVRGVRSRVNRGTTTRNRRSTRNPRRGR